MLLGHKITVYSFVSSCFYSLRKYKMVFTWVWLAWNSAAELISSTIGGGGGGGGGVAGE